MAWFKGNKRKNKSLSDLLYQDEFDLTDSFEQIDKNDDSEGRVRLVRIYQIF